VPIRWEAMMPAMAFSPPPDEELKNLGIRSFLAVKGLLFRQM
jgi:hypothetical protein